MALFSLNGDNKDNIIKTFLFVLGYGVLFYCLQLFIFRIGIASVLPDSTTLARWDAFIYHDVAVRGYYHDASGHNTGVYVLLPWLWRLLHADYLGMAMVNLVLFAAGTTIISRIYSVTTTGKLLWLTTPSLYFMFVPYTEALFFLLIAIFFYGIMNNNKWMTWLGLFLAALARPTALFLLPSLFIMELLANDKKDILKVVGNYIIYYALPTLAGLSLFIWVQHYETGLWLPYFKDQVTDLEHKLSMPVLPFCNYYGSERVTWLCALALVPCLLALILMVIKICKWASRGKKYSDKVWVITLCYLPIVMFTMIFCNPKWGNGHTNLLGIHRYVFCSPFIFVLFYNLVERQRDYKWKHFVFMLLLCNIVWMSMGAYMHIYLLLFYNFNTLLVFGYMLYANKKTSWAFLALCAVNLFFQVSLFQQFIHGLFTD